MQPFFSQTSPMGLSRDTTRLGQHPQMQTSSSATKPVLLHHLASHCPLFPDLLSFPHLTHIYQTQSVNGFQGAESKYRKHLVLQTAQCCPRRLPYKVTKQQDDDKKAVAEVSGSFFESCALQQGSAGQHQLPSHHMQLWGHAHAAGIAAGHTEEVMGWHFYPPA